ncbi:hypothetical protein FLA_2659 [Filimonas lacunae]|nr:hypothetical protein FLA_2659 [Filimonas lacunae]
MACCIIDGRFCLARIYQVAFPISMGGKSSSEAGSLATETYFCPS